MIHRIRGFVLPTLAALSLLLAVAGTQWPWLWWVLGLVAGPLTLLGLWDVIQKRHSILRSYPVLGHLRWVIEDLGPELHQYVVETNKSGRPFNRDQRSLMYQRAKNVEDKKPFGTEMDTYAPGYTWLTHSLAPVPISDDPVAALRFHLGGPDCTHPISASIYNISAMSFGALSANAVRALSAGAKKGNFFHNTGEGGISRYHRSGGGDLVWQVGTGYFGCRTEDGRFDAGMFEEQAGDDQVKAIEIKLSQGAKPGHGGILPGAKVTPEIAEARRVAVGVDCLSPSGHNAFSTPIGLLEFVARLRELSGGKPIGFKLCVGRFEEVFAVCKAMLETGITPDFITVDGAEGGTGAAPIEFSDRLGTPLKEGVLLLHNALVGVGLRDRVKLCASGKLVSAVGIAAVCALGADWCNTARGFMFALGCIQAQRCHTNACPVGVTTQNQRLQRSLVPADKAERVYNFHRNTVHTLAELLGAAGLQHPRELEPRHLCQRLSPNKFEYFDKLYDFLEPGQLLEGRAHDFLQRFWDEARPDTFRVA
jgi:glutamate synthase domain-containing protein 2